MMIVYTRLRLPSLNFDFATLQFAMRVDHARVGVGGGQATKMTVSRKSRARESVSISTHPTRFKKR
jgi:hypothetical protein